MAQSSRRRGACPSSQQARPAGPVANSSVILHLCRVRPNVLVVALPGYGGPTCPMLDPIPFGDRQEIIVPVSCTSLSEGGVGPDPSSSRDCHPIVILFLNHRRKSVKSSDWYLLGRPLAVQELSTHMTTRICLGVRCFCIHV
jgi:hypothetical protein